MNSERKKALLFLILAAILWSTGGLIIKLINWNPVAIASARSGIAAIVMLIYLRKPIKHFGKFKILGGFTYAALVTLFVVANKLTTSANAILLQFTAPIWVAIFSRCFLKEKIAKYDWITIIFVMFGMILFFVGDLNTGNSLGNFFAVLSGVAMAAMVIFLKLQHEDSPIEMTLVGNVITLLIGLPFFFLSIPDTNTIIGLLLLGVFQLGISYILYTTAIKHVSAIEATIIPVVEPLLNPFWVFLGTGEAPGRFAILGGSIVIGAVILRGLYQQKHPTS